MSESVDFHTLFIRLQSRYPMSSLITELVQSDRPVVRALVQVGGITLVTSMATAPTVEQAEDQARLRVLAMLGIDTTHVSSFSSLGMVPPPAVADMPPQSLTDSWATPTEFLPTLATPATIAPDTIPRSPMLSPLVFDPSLQPSDALPAWAELSDQPPEVGMSNDKANQPKADEGKTSQGKTSLELEVEPEVPMAVPFVSQPLMPEPYQPEAPATGSDRPEVPEPTMPAPSNEGKAGGKPRKASPAKSAAPPEPAIPAADSLDLTELIVQIDHEMERVCWTKEEGRNYLKRTYGKRSRQQLTDDELIDFLIYLKALPTPIEVPFG